MESGRPLLTGGFNIGIGHVVSAAFCNKDTEMG